MARPRAWHSWGHVWAGSSDRSICDSETTVQRGVAKYYFRWACTAAPITFEVITLLSGRLFRKFLMIRKAGKVMQVTGPMVRRGSRIVIPTGKRNGAPLPPVRLSRARGGFQRAWGDPARVGRIARVEHASDVAAQNSAHRWSHAPFLPLGRRGHCDV